MDPNEEMTDAETRASIEGLTFPGSSLKTEMGRRLNTAHMCPECTRINVMPKGTDRFICTGCNAPLRRTTVEVPAWKVSETCIKCNKQLIKRFFNTYCSGCDIYYF